MNSRLLICIILVASLTGCVSVGGSGRSRESRFEILHLTATFRDCRDKGQECFEEALGLGVTGWNKEGDTYKAWEATDRWHDSQEAFVRIFHGVTSAWDDSREETCKLEINFRDNKVRRWTFTGHCRL